MKSYELARRDLVGGLSIGMALAARIAAANAQVGAPTQVGQDVIWSHEYWAQKANGRQRFT
jgi:hypothetical protein